MKKKAIIFDLDGTLLNTIDDIADAVNNALKFYGFPLHTVEEYKELIGEGIYLLAKKALPVEVDEAFIDAFVEKIQNEYHIVWSNKTCLYAGIASLLTELNRKNIPLAIFSNKPHEFTILNVLHYLSKWKFVKVYGASQDNPTKPNPKISLKIANSFNVKPNEIIHIGDTHIDIQTALNADMLPLGVSWGFRKPNELIQAGAVEVLSQPKELLYYV